MASKQFENQSISCSLPAPAPLIGDQDDKEKGNFSIDSEATNSDEEQLDDTPFLSHQLPADQESFSEKFLRNILTTDYQNLMPRRREKFVEITKTVTVTEIVNGAPDKHPSTCEVKITNISSDGPQPVNVSIKHSHEKWHSSEQLDCGGEHLSDKSTVINIRENHRPFEEIVTNQDPNYIYEDNIQTKVEREELIRNHKDIGSTPLFNKSSDNIIDLEFKHPILIETSHKQMNGNSIKSNKPAENGGQRKFAGLRKKRVSTSTTTETTETEKVTKTSRIRSRSQNGSIMSREGKPEVQTLYYRKFIETNNENGDSDSGSVILYSDEENIKRDSINRRSKSMDSRTIEIPVAAPRTKKLRREESLHYYRDDDEVIGNNMATINTNPSDFETKRRVKLIAPEPGVTSVSLNDTTDNRNMTAGITSVSMNDTYTDTSFESKFSTIPRAKSTPPSQIHHIKINVIGPTNDAPSKNHPIVGRVGESVTMDIHIERRRSSSESRQKSFDGEYAPPPKPPRRSKWDDHIGQPLMTSTPMTTIERKQARDNVESRKSSMNSEPASRKSTRSSRPPDINIIQCEHIEKRSPLTPIVVVNQNPSRRSSQDLLSDQSVRRRKSTVTDIDWYAAFNMKDPSSPIKHIAKSPLSDDRKVSRESRRRASESSIATAAANIDLNQVFCTGEYRTKKDEKCQCNACQLIRMSEADRAARMRKNSHSKSHMHKYVDYNSRSSTLPSRHKTPPVNIELDDIFNPKKHQKPPSSKPPTPPRKSSIPLSDIFSEEKSRNIDRNQVKRTNNRENNDGNELENQHEIQLLKGGNLRQNSGEVMENKEVDWIGEMMQSANDWEQSFQKLSRKASTSSTGSKKSSIARRISVDDLKKTDPTSEVILPPSNATIDDIFTALAPKDNEIEDDKKTFIVTRKQRAQDVEAIDFGDPKYQPIAPPRKKSEINVVSTATVKFDDISDYANQDENEEEDKNHADPSNISINASFNKDPETREVVGEQTATFDSEPSPSEKPVAIDLDDVFSKIAVDRKVAESDENDKKLARRIREFEESRTKPVSTATNENKNSSLSNFESNISMDHVFNNSQSLNTKDKNTDEDIVKTTTSTAALILQTPDQKNVELNLDDVWKNVEAHSNVNDESKDEEKIAQRIKEFEQSREKKPVVEAVACRKPIASSDLSDISINDIFNEKTTQKSTEYDDIPVSTPTEKESSSKIEIESILVDESQLRNIDESNDQILNKTAEFEQKIDEKAKFHPGDELQNGKPKAHLLPDSDISMDDVFNVTGKESTDNNQTDDRIMQRVTEFERTMEENEKYNHSEEHGNEKHAQHLLPDSNISIDDVFSNSENKPVGISNIRKPQLDEGDRIMSRVEEFERTMNDNDKYQHVEVEGTKKHVQHLLPESDISMDDVFNRNGSVTTNENVAQTSEDRKPQPNEEADTRILPRVEEFERTIEENDKYNHVEGEGADKHVPHLLPASNISIDDVFNNSGTESTTEKYDEADDKILTRVAEFERTMDENAKNHHVDDVINEKNTQCFLPDSEISMDEVFDVSGKKLGDRSSAVTSNTEQSQSDEKEDDKIFSRVAEFKHTMDENDKYQHANDDDSEKHAQHQLPDSNISMDDVFSNIGNKPTNEAYCETSNVRKSQPDATEDRTMPKVEEFERTVEENDRDLHNDDDRKENLTRHHPESEISLDDVFNFPTSTSKSSHLDPRTNTQSDNSETVSSTKDYISKTVDEEIEHRHDEKSKENDTYRYKPIVENSLKCEISLDDIFSVGKNDETEKNDPQPHSPKQSGIQSFDNIPPSHWQVTPSNNLDNSFGLSQKEPLPTQTPPNSDSEQDFSSKLPIQQMRIDINLDDVFSSPPMTNIATKSKRKSVEKVLYLPADNWINELVEKATDEATKEAPKTPKTPKTPVQMIAQREDSYHPSPTRISSEIKYEWIADILSNNDVEDEHQTDEVFSQTEDKTWVSSVVYRPTTETSTYTLRASQQPVEEEDNKPTTSSDISWIEDMLREMTSREKTTTTVTTTTTTTTTTTEESDEELLEKVFKLFECDSVNDGKKCDCSACQLTRLSENELEELKRRWKARKNIENNSKMDNNETNVIHSVSTEPSQFSIDDIFAPQESSFIRVELTQNVEAQVSASRNQEPFDPTNTIMLEQIFKSVPTNETIHVRTTDDIIPSISSPVFESTKTIEISPRVTETVTRTHQWKEDKSEIPLDEIFSPTTTTTFEDSRRGSRRFSNFYEDRSEWDTIRSEDSGVASGGKIETIREISRPTADVVIDEAFKGIFDEPPKTTAYDDYYISSLHQDDDTDSDIDPNSLDVTQFVDDILGKSLDEAAFLSSTKSFKNHTDTSIDRKKTTDKVHPYYRTRTDTSIDKKQKHVVISEENDDVDHNSEQGSSNQNNIMNLIFVDQKKSPMEKEQESTSSTTNVTTTSTTKDTETIERLSDEEFLEIEVKSEYFLIKGSYSLVINKNDPLGQLLQKIRDQNQSLATLDFSLSRKFKKLLMSCLREKAMRRPDSEYEGVSNRGQSLISSVDNASTTFLKMNANRFEPITNPKGIVNFCTAENNICTPLLEDRFKHLELFFPITEHLVRYPPSGGWPECREAVSKYFKEFMNARVDPSEIVLTASTRTGYDVVSYCLFEPDDVLLTNGPIYTGTISNCNERAQCLVEVVETDLQNPRLDVKKYKEKFEQYSAEDTTVSGIIIVNPHNPLGVVFPPDQVIELINWATSNNLHVIIDEVFANCVFDKESKFKSFLSYRHRVSRPQNVAYLWSVSKDFGLPGLKFAVIQTSNESLRKAALKLQLYHPCSPFVQDFAEKLLSDFDWLHSFHTEVNHRMLIHYKYTAENLKLLNIPFVTAQAGIFVFADFSKHLPSLDEKSELEFFDHLGSNGVMLTPGVHQKCHKYGWFRIVYACSKEELEEGFQRLFALLKSPSQPAGSVRY